MDDTTGPDTQARAARMLRAVIQDADDLNEAPFPVGAVECLLDAYDRLRVELNETRRRSEQRLADWAGCRETLAAVQTDLAETRAAGAVLARDVPAGRDLTAADVRDAHHASFGVPWGEEFREFVADHLNRIARGDQR